jgi:hypothetical protein
MPVLQPFAAPYVLLLASASPLLAKESERIYGLYSRLVERLKGGKRSPRKKKLMSNLMRRLQGSTRRVIAFFLEIALKPRPRYVLRPEPHRSG